VARSRKAIKANWRTITNAESLDTNNPVSEVQEVLLLVERD